MAYAEKTTISISRTKADIEDLIQKAGAEQFISGYKDNMSIIGFTLANRQIRFILPLPEKTDNEFLYTPGRRTKRSSEQVHAAWEQACRSKWCSLYLIIKAKLEAVESGISTVEHEFFYDIVLPNGQTLGEYIAPQLELSYFNGDMPPLLPLLNDNKNGSL